MRPCPDLAAQSSSPMEAIRSPTSSWRPSIALAQGTTCEYASCRFHRTARRATTAAACTRQRICAPTASGRCLIPNTCAVVRNPFFLPGTPRDPYAKAARNLVLGSRDSLNLLESALLCSINGAFLTPGLPERGPALPSLAVPRAWASGWPEQVPGRRIRFTMFPGAATEAWTCRFGSSALQGLGYFLPVGNPSRHLWPRDAQRGRQPSG